MRTCANLVVALLAVACGGGNRGPLPVDVPDAGATTPPPAPSRFSAADAVPSPEWYPPEDAPADPESWHVSQPRDADASPGLELAIGADGEVAIAHVVQDMWEYGVDVRVLRYSRAKGWLGSANVFTQGRHASYGSSSVDDLQVLDNGAALLVFHRNPDHEATREALHFASDYRPGRGWSAPKQLGPGQERAVVRSADGRLHALICGAKWQSWTLDQDQGLVPGDALSFAAMTGGGRQSGPCGVGMRDDVAIGYDVRIKQGEMFGAFQDAPLSFVESAGSVQVGTTSRAPVLAFADTWTTLLTNTASYERNADGTWSEADRLLDANPSSWLPALGIALFSSEDEQRLMLQRDAGDWSGPFVVHPAFSRSAMIYPNGDLALCWSDYVSGSNPHVWEVRVQRRVAGTWYAEELLGESRMPGDAAASPAGDLVVALSSREGITLHAKGPHFR